MLTKNEIDEIIETFDTNKDGMLSLDEVGLSCWLTGLWRFC